MSKVILSGSLKILSDFGGLIEEVAISIPDPFFESRSTDRMSVFKNLIVCLPAEIKIHVVVESKSVDRAHRWLGSFNHACVVDFVILPDGETMKNSDVWIQDSFLVGVHDRRRVFIDMAEGRGGHHAQWLQANAASVIRENSINLEGGNCLVGDDFRLIGAKSLYATVSLLKGDDRLSNAYRIHQDLDSRRMFVFGFTWEDLRTGTVFGSSGDPPSGAFSSTEKMFQEPFHIDLAISLTGLRDERSRPIILVADPRGTTDPDGPGARYLDSRVNASANRLEAQGFHVLRNKVPVLPSEGRCGSEPGQNGVWRAYNNVIVENDVRANETRPLVWVPQFADLEPDLEPYDRLNRREWETLGFKVIGIYGWSSLSSGLGTLRCATKVLQRAPWVHDQRPE